MESFLKYLRGGAVAGNQRAPVVATTIAASVCEGGGGDVDDDASFFDLEFAVPADESAASDAEEERVELNFAVAGDDDDVASADEVVAVDAVAPGGESEKKEDSAESKAPPPASVLRPATTKFRVLLLKLRKPKVAVPVEGTGDGAAPAKTASRFLIKFRVDDAPLVSLFTRDNSSRGSDAAVEAQEISAEEEHWFAKEVVLKYLNKIKPLYVKASRRYGERARFPGATSEGGEETTDNAPPAPPSATEPRPVVGSAPRGGVPAGLKQVCKRLGKSRSAVAAAPSPPPLPTPSPVPQRRDDSLLQLEDGIQSAIAHCKRSFNAVTVGDGATTVKAETAARDAGLPHPILGQKEER